MKARRIEKLLVTDGKGKLTGLLTLKDSEQAVLNPSACKDALGPPPRRRRLDRWATRASSAARP
jgi:hypothetical protein